MKPFKPQEFFATSWTWDDPRCRERILRLLAGFGKSTADLQVIEEADLDGLIRRKNWLDVWRRQGTVSGVGDPDLVFNSFRWHGSAGQAALRERLPILGEGQGFASSLLHALYGYPTFQHFEDGNRKRQIRDDCCWSLHDLHTGWGCFHKCQYCSRGRVATVMLNVEEWLERVDGLLDANPWQKVIRFDTECDCLVLEPEYGACADLVNHFATKEDRYIILFSKSDNVDFLLDLDHCGHTIMLWTLSTPTVSRAIEVDTATTEQRIEAARKCQEAGYPVRFKFKPIVPIRGWREEATRTLELLFDAVKPDNLSMEMLFFRSVEELTTMFDMALFEPEFVQMMKEHEAAGGMADPYKVIPPDFRVEVYEYYAREVQRLSPETPLSLCSESHAVWKKMIPLLGQTPGNFICNCGPACIPHLPACSMGYAEDFKPFVVTEPQNGIERNSE
ncbi:MAG: hypothetical protein HN742_07990 [Lentisphaerae bacterium]|jgi:spore photoproduct lyase|nr:hypothetical protein [Lentisphaerota bacterium]MBT4817015.1 hypothetical protein [Lentisphaerota bacterium]MBT5604717.1 hypothetical protein [Lentisphaerota bacterium]MBT7058109.1 hypothetical protein [Lentisphaerota bacterium]MBT7841797.1 hypothetical protein [Lentisphaerota bacterium]